MNIPESQQDPRKQPAASALPSVVQAPAGNGQQAVLYADDVVMDYQRAAAAKTVPGDAMQPVALSQLALSHVSLALAAGESLAVMGPSGSGKSTLLHVLAGILRPTAGSVYLRGNDLARLGDAERTRLRRSEFGFVFQSGQLLPELPAIENIALPVMLGGTPYKQAISMAFSWLDALRMTPLAQRRPGEMSGGQMQRIAIARALCIRPSVVFADEPTGALDRKTGADVMRILTEACTQNGSSLVVVTHDPSVAAFCSRTVRMSDGLLVDPGASERSAR
ncbi:ABC transporter ATP-binding protein [Bifidobacterium psychraerophilum]|uniref:ABC transporter ATP-binding protein n=1 Tax=Bifidobacterium psychraerophilum TaxID=218140 RepID=UPI0039EB6C26